MSFPYLDENQGVRFPPLDEATPEGIVAVGGNLSPGMLLSAYRQGVFPWFSDDDDPILWWSPDPRYVLFVDELSVPRRLARSLKKEPFDITFDKAFDAVIRSCATVFRPREMGTWITEEMFQAYTRLHELGYAHSVEARRDGKLVGGLYGVSLGGVFYGESMFHRETNASKAAFVALVRGLEAAGIRLIDCQMETPLLASFGARYIPREEFAGHLIALLAEDTRRGSWESWSSNS
jgi:leucyl/phenylalanyl-tRNA---protein transferase